MSRLNYEIILITFVLATLLPIGSHRTVLAVDIKGTVADDNIRGLQPMTT